MRFIKRGSPESGPSDVTQRISLSRKCVTSWSLCKHHLIASAGSSYPQVDVDYNEETQKKINAGQYRPAPNDQVLNEIMKISEIWERPPDRHVHVFVGLPSEVGSPTPVNVGGEYLIHFFALPQDI